MRRDFSLTAEVSLDDAVANLDEDERENAAEHH